MLQANCLYTGISYGPALGDGNKYEKPLPFLPWKICMCVHKLQRQMLFIWPSVPLVPALVALLYSLVSAVMWTRKAGALSVLYFRFYFKSQVVIYWSECSLDGNCSRKPSRRVRARHKGEVQLNKQHPCRRTTTLHHRVNHNCHCQQRRSTVIHRHLTSHWLGFTRHRHWVRQLVIVQHRSLM